MMCTNVHGSLIQNSQKMEAMRMLVSRERVDQAADATPHTRAHTQEHGIDMTQDHLL